MTGTLVHQLSLGEAQRWTLLAPGGAGRQPCPAPVRPRRQNGALQQLLRRVGRPPVAAAVLMQALTLSPAPLHPCCLGRLQGQT